MATSYRNSGHTTRTINSSDESEINGSNSSDSDAADALWLKKRPRPDPGKGNESGVRLIPSNVPRTAMKSRPSRNANIWGSVLTEQSSNDISSSLGAVGMQHYISRGPESFDLPSNIVIQRPDRHSESSDSSDVGQGGSKDLVQPNPPEIPKSNPKNKRKRKKTQKRNNVPAFKPGQEVSLNRRCELSDTDAVDKVAEEITFRLWERKKDLIRALTEILGVPKAIDFCNKTEDIERSGGIMTMKGIRRRTPGGTFLHLIRNDPNLDQEPIKTIFALEAERDRMQWEQRKVAKKAKVPQQGQRTSESENLRMDINLKQSDIMECSEQLGDAGCPNGNSRNNDELSEGEIIDSD